MALIIVITTKEFNQQVHYMHIGLTKILSVIFLIFLCWQYFNIVQIFFFFLLSFRIITIFNWVFIITKPALVHGPILDNFYCQILDKIFPHESRLVQVELNLFSFKN